MQSVEHFAMNIWRHVWEEDGSADSKENILKVIQYTSGRLANLSKLSTEGADVTI